MRNSRTRRFLSGLLAGVIMLNQVPVLAAAEDTGLCEHHTTHEDCCYVEGVSGSLCVHEHTEECYISVTICLHEHGECTYVADILGADCDHFHDAVCGYTDTAEGNSCNHTHDEECGFAEGVTGIPCDHVCADSNGCITKQLSCAHIHDDICGCREELLSQPCTFECTECTENEVENVCTCGSTDSIHETLCPMYIAPDNPSCTCMEKCTAEAINTWCDICGVQGESCCNGNDLGITLESDNGPYAISTKEELNAIRNNLSAEYYLTADIEFTSADFEEGGAFYNDGAKWIPIGTPSAPFTGTLDGKGHTISGLNVYIEGSSNSFGGLFGYVSNSTSDGGIFNLGMLSNYVFISNAVGDCYAGSVAGYCENGKIEGCYHTGYVAATSSSGIAYAGGITGFKQYGQLSRCYNTGTVAGGGTLGGIVGGTQFAAISNCFNTTGKSGNYVGGIAGSCSFGTVDNCYSLGNHSSSYGSGFAGGIVGMNSNCTVSNSYYNSSTTSGGGTKMTEAAMREQSALYGFDFTVVWTIDGNSDYPYPELQDVTMHYTRTLESISVTTLPTKTTYLQNEDILDVTGGVITLTYNDGSTSTIAMAADMVTGFDNSKVGQQILTVTFGGKTVSFTVNVKETVILSSITVSKLPIKTEYLQNEELLDVTGGEITLTYSDGSASVIAMTEDMVTGFDGSILGEQEITVSYAGMRSSFCVSILDASERVVSISISMIPTKTKYVQGVDTELDVQGGAITVLYMDDHEEVVVIDKEMVHGFNISSLGIQFLTVTYSGQSAEFYIEVHSENTWDFYGGNGSFDKPYLISDKNHLNNIRYYANDNFLIIEDINFNAEDFAEGRLFYNEGMGWIPFSFYGRIDGSGHIINDLYIKRASSSSVYAGLIATNYGTIENLGIGAGEICAEPTYKSPISYSAYAGSIAAINEGTIRGCYNAAVIISNNDARGESYAGGIAGQNKGTIQNCFNIGQVKANTNASYDLACAGGVAGRLEGGTIEKCYNIGDTAATASDSAYSGGVVAFRSSGSIKNCVYLKTGSDGAGGKACSVIQMMCMETYADFDFEETWELCESYPFPKLKETTVPWELTGIKMSTYPVREKYLYENDTLDVSGGTILLMRNGYLELESVEITEKMVSGFDNTVLGEQTISVSYGNYATTFTVEIINEDTANFAGGVGSKACPYVIENESHLMNVQNYPNAYFVVNNDVVLTQTNWAPINQFNGYFDGQGHEIKNLSITADGYGDIVCLGLFAQNSGAICNLAVSGSIYVSSYYTTYAGGITGNNSGIIEECCSNVIIDVTAKCEAYYNRFMGVYGYSDNAYAGGIAGYNSGTINNCYATGDVNAVSAWASYQHGVNTYVYDGVAAAGGIVPYNDGTISFCYSIGNVTASAYRGASEYKIASSYNACYYPETAVQYQSDYIDFDFETIWGMDPFSGYIYPQLKWQAKEITAISIAKESATLVEMVEGLWPDMSSVTVRATYADGTTKEIALIPALLEELDINKIGTQIVHLTCGDIISEETITFVVKEKAPVSLAVKTMPSKLTYVQGQPLDVEDGVLTLTYSNNTTQDIKLTDAKIAYDAEAIGTVAVTVTYEGLTATFDVTVNERVVKSVVLTQPSKLSYKEGQELDLTGGFVTITYASDDNYSEKIPLALSMLSGYDKDTPGIQTLTFCYLEHTETFVVRVVAKQAVEITISTLPTKLEYFAKRDLLDVSGGSISVIYDNGDSEIIDMTTEMVSGFDNTVAGKQSITVTFGSATTSFEVEITTATVVFKNEDGSILSSTQYMYGDEIVIPTDPIKEADVAYTYVFAGWDKEVVNCAGDAIYTAVYINNLRKYPITFMFGEQSQTIEVEYGATPNASMVDLNGYGSGLCDVLSWSPEFAAVTGEAIYVSSLRQLHTEVTDAAVAPTCTTNGLTEGSHCSVCNEVIVAQEEIPARHVVEDGICIQCQISGTCGNNLTWEFDKETGNLTISGTGKMDNFSYPDYAPWLGHKEQIKAVDIKSGVTSIGTFAFKDYVNIETIVIPASVTLFGDCVFLNCSSLTNITIPNGTTRISNQMFQGCQSLTSITLPDSVTRISQSAFSGCSGLTSIRIPSSVTNIEGAVFSNCSNLSGIWVDENNAAYCNDSRGVLFNKNKTTLIQAPGKISEDYTVPDNVTSIGTSAFSGCSSLQNVALPNSVVEISWLAFYDCTSLKSIILPENLSIIEEDMFVNCTSLTSVILPEKLTKIYDFAFENCISLSEIVLPDSVTEIWYAAFSGCSSLNEVVFPAGITSIGDNAFNGCSKLQNITFMGDAPAFLIDDPPGYPQECSAFRGVTATVYYPASNSTWTADVIQDYGGTLSWVPYGTVEKRVTLDSAELDGQTSVWMDGVEYAVQMRGDVCYVDLPDSNAKTMVSYTYHVSDTSDIHTQYPVSMKVWALSNKDGIYTSTRVEELDNILQYSGMSIRVAGKKGIRMITSIEKEKKSTLISDGLAGYTLQEYGTVVAWASQLDDSNPLVLGQSYAKSNYAYKRGVADPVFAYNGNLMQYTNVLTGFSLDQCKNDIAMRPYMILEDAEGNEITLYGGIVERSIGYIASQNANEFDPTTESDAYKYIWDIILHVYGEDYVPEAA